MKVNNSNLLCFVRINKVYTKKDLSELYTVICYYHFKRLLLSLIIHLNSNIIFYPHFYFFGP